MAYAEPAQPRERSPPRGDRRPLAVQRAEQEAAMVPGNLPKIAVSKRDKTLPRPPTATVEVSSSSSQPPPPPGAGAVSKGTAQHFNIAKKPRSATLTRPLVPQAPLTGAKHKAEDDGGVQGRPTQPPVPSAARATKRVGPPLLRPGARPSQPAGPPTDDLQLPPKGKKIDTPPRRINKKRGTIPAVKWRQSNTKWSKVAR